MLEVCLPASRVWHLQFEHSSTLHVKVGRELTLRVTSGGNPSKEQGCALWNGCAEPQLLLQAGREHDLEQLTSISMK